MFEHPKSTVQKANGAGAAIASVSAAFGPMEIHQGLALWVTRRISEESTETFPVFFSIQFATPTAVQPQNVPEIDSAG